MTDISSAISEFNNELAGIKEIEDELEEKREKFVQDYSIDKIQELSIDEYVIGTGSNDGFCYRLENELEGLGSNKVKKGSLMYGIAVDQRKYEQGILEYKIDKGYGDEPEKAFEIVKREIIDLLEAAKRNDRNAILDSKVYSTFKYKLLFTYFPERYVNICTVSNALAAVVALGYSLDEADMLTLYDLLSEWRDNNPDTVDWTNYELMTFLYRKLDLKELKDSDEFQVAKNPKARIEAASHKSVVEAKERVRENEELKKKAEEASVKENAKKLIPGKTFTHKTWGMIEVVEVQDDKVKVRRSSDGEVKTLRIANVFDFIK